MHSNGGFSYEGLNHSACGVLCDVHGLATCACFHHSPQLFLRAIVFVNRYSFANLIIGQGWEVVLDDGNIVIRQEDDFFFDEIAQEERQARPHFHHEGVEECALTGRECSDLLSKFKRACAKIGGACAQSYR